MQHWLGFIGTEWHEAVFVPLLNRHATDDVKPYSRDKVDARVKVLQQHLAQNTFVTDGFGVADAYFVTALNRAAFGGVDLTQWPAVEAYYRRLVERPSVARALAEEVASYREETAHRRQA